MDICTDIQSDRIFSQISDRKYGYIISAILPYIRNPAGKSSRYSVAGRIYSRISGIRPDIRFSSRLVIRSIPSLNGGPAVVTSEPNLVNPGLPQPQPHALHIGQCVLYDIVDR